MTAWLLAAVLAAPAAAQPARAPAGTKPYGVLLLAYDVDVAWRRELASLHGAIKDAPVETVENAGDAISVQRALDRLVAERAAKVVAVPLETISDSPRMDETRFLFGVRETPALDVPGSARDFGDRPGKPLKPVTKSLLNAPSDWSRSLPLPVGGAASTVKRLKSPVPLVLAPALDRSPLLLAILADRAKALSPNPARESLVLVGRAPRSDAALKAWKASAQAIADRVGAKAGYRKALAVGVRDGVRADQQDRDRAELQAAFRGLVREGRVAVVPLSPEAGRLNELLNKELGGFIAYRWNGQGIQGDRRLADWIKASAETAAKLPDGRRYKDDQGGLR